MSVDVTEQSIIDALHQVPREHWGYVLEILRSLETTASQPNRGDSAKTCDTGRIARNATDRRRSQR